MNPHNLLPADLADALLVGRVWRPDPVGGPSVVVVRGGEVVDITATAPTVSDLLDHPDRVSLARQAKGESLGDVHALMDATLQGAQGPRLLAPCDLQPVKAAGVTDPLENGLISAIPFLFAVVVILGAVAWLALG